MGFSISCAAHYPAAPRKGQLSEIPQHGTTRPAALFQDSMETELRAKRAL
jgi:hypothetical protein